MSARVKTVSVLIVDDHAMMREALAALIDRHRDMEVAGTAADGRAGAELAAKLKPDVITLDVAMPSLNGIDAAKLVRRVAPETKIIVLTAHEEDLYIQYALEAGVDGYVSKSSAAATLAEAILAVARGEKAFSPAVLKRLAQYEKGAGGLHRKPSEQLSEREIQVLQLIAEGRANKQTADELGISIKTVEKHRQSVMDKLHIHDTAGLTRYAIAAGLVETPAVFANRPTLAPAPKRTSTARKQRPKKL